MNRLIYLMFTVIIASIFPSINLIGSSSTLTVKKKGETGNDQCERIDCLDLEGALSNDHSRESSLDLDILLKINHLSPQTHFNFPWKVKAFSLQGIEIGESLEIQEDDFKVDPLTLSLRKAKLSASLKVVDILTAILVGDHLNGDSCFIDRCGKTYSNIGIVFKIFSGNTEIDASCTSFNSLDLIPDSHIATEAFRTCKCLEEMLAGSPSRKSKVSEGITSYYENVDRSFNLSINKIQKENDKNEIEIFPNPVSSFVSVANKTESDQTIPISLQDLRGRTLRKFNLHQHEIMEINVSSYPKGIYLLRYKLENQSKVRKLIIK